MFVPITPKRPDFCGCPPCPLCFVWVEPKPVDAPAPDAATPPIQITIVDSMERYFLDILGRTPTAEEEKTLREAAERIHVYNLNKDQRYSDELREMDQLQHIERKIDALARDNRIAAKAPKPLNTVTLDGQDLSYIEEEAKKIAAFRAAQEEEIRRQIAGVPSIMYGPGVDERFVYVATVNLSVTASDEELREISKPKLTEANLRRIQAEADAKERMKRLAREPVRR